MPREILPLEKGILYGPVNSRRYGRSLGINLMPREYKVCSFNCMYCHYGVTSVTTMDLQDRRDDMPTRDEVASDLEKALQAPLDLDLITFSGNGEPTLHPEFPELVDAVVGLRDKYVPEVRVALLSNSTGLVDERVRRCIRKIDLPVFKLDAGTPETFHALNRPAHEIEFENIVVLLTSMKDIYLQTVFVDGVPSNTSPEELTAYIKTVRRIAPREIHIYSIDRPAPHSRIVLVSPEGLEEIAARLRDEAGLAVQAFYPAKRC